MSPLLVTCNELPHLLQACEGREEKEHISIHPAYLQLSSSTNSTVCPNQVRCSAFSIQTLPRTEKKESL